MRISQFTFGSGKLNRNLIGRRDLKKYYEGAFEITNFVVKRQGILEKRHGFKEVAKLTNDANIVRMFSFIYDNDSCHYVVFSTTNIYVYDNQGNAITSIKNIYLNKEKDINEMEYIQVGDILFFSSRYCAPFKITRQLNQDGTFGFTLGKIVFDDYDDTIAKPTLSTESFIENNATGATARDVKYRVSEVVGSKELCLSNTIAVTHYLPWSAGSIHKLKIIRNSNNVIDKYNIYRNDGNGWGYIGSTDSASSFDGEGGKYEVGDFKEYETTSDEETEFIIPDVISTSDGIVDKSGTDIRVLLSKLNIRVHSITSEDITSETIDGKTVIKCKVPRPKSVFTFYLYSKSNLKKVAPIKSVSLTNYAEDIISVAEQVGYKGVANDDGSYTINKTFTEELSEEQIEEEVSILTEEINTSEALLKTLDLDKSVENIIGGKFCVGVKDTSSTPNDFHVRPSESMLITDAFDGGNVFYFVDDYIQLDYTKYPPRYLDVFDSVGNYPGVVTLYQQRMIFASTVKDPSMFWMSVPGDIYNFSVHDSLQEDDTINAALPLTRGPNILHMISHKYLIALCENSECIIKASGDAGLSYKTIMNEQQSYTGSSMRVRPLLCGNAILFCDRAGQSAREYKYDYAMDAMSGKDVSVLNSTTLETNSGIVDWVYQMFPDSIIWCVMGNGKLCAFTYMPEQEVYAWTDILLPDNYSAISISCGDSLEEVNDEDDQCYKMSSIAIIAKNTITGDFSLFILDNASYSDKLLDGSELAYKSWVETVVPDSQGQLDQRKKRLVKAIVRGRNIDNVKIGAISGEDKCEGINVEVSENRLMNGQTAESQLQCDYCYDPRLVVTDYGTKRCEISGIQMDIDCMDIE